MIDLPSKKMVISHSYVNVHQRVNHGQTISQLLEISCTKNVVDLPAPKRERDREIHIYIYIYTYIYIVYVCVRVIYIYIYIYIYMDYQKP